MDELKTNNILLFNPNQLANVRKELGYDDYNKLKQDIDIFEDWIKKQNHFRIRDFDREYLERYIIYNKGSVEKAKKHFDRLCTLRNLMPEFLQNIDVKHEFSPLFNCCHISFLPKPTTDNYRVMIIKLFGDDDKMELIHLYRYLVALVEYMLCHDYCFGYELLTDTRDISLGLASKLNPILIKKAVTLIVDHINPVFYNCPAAGYGPPLNMRGVRPYSTSLAKCVFADFTHLQELKNPQETMGLRLKNLHFLNGSKIFDTVISLIKQGLSDKLSKRIRIHSSYDTLYEYIPRGILPKDYGGDEKSVKEIHDTIFKEASSDALAARLKFMESTSTDESCRLTTAFNEEYSGMPGSFKTLCVD